MSAPQWRRSLVGFWIAVICVTFAVIGSTASRSRLLLVLATVPPAMLLSLWNEDRPLVTGFLHRRSTHL